MKAATLRAPIETPEARPTVRAISPSPVVDQQEPIRLLDHEQAARSLARFLAEAREILDRLDEAWAHREADRPGKRARREILRLLAGAGDWVDFHDLPPMGPLGRAGGRSLALKLAEEGVVELHRDPTYPNNLLLRITPEGREDLRRRAVEEAMDHLRGTGQEGLAVVEEASRALYRLADLI